jgi:F-type H+-transporting ATPase subunit epsilon
MRSFKLEIITPQRKAFSEDVESVVVPTVNGMIGVLALHETLFSALTEGEIKIISASKEYFLAIGSGFMEVTKTGVSVLVTSAFHAHELNEAEIKKAREIAKEALSKHITGIELSAAQSLLRRSVLELKVFHRKHERPMPA